MTVQELRKAQGMTQEQFAQKAGIKLSTLQKIERAGNMPPGTSIESAVKIARALGVTVEEIVQID